MNTQIIAIANQKGGVGKTTTCANLGIGLAQAGRKVLLIDGDPQGSLTISLGHPQPDKLPFTLSDAMGRILMDEPLRPGEGILHHPEGVDLMPADIQLSGMEVSLVNAMSRETILRQYLDTLKGQYSHMGAVYSLWESNHCARQSRRGQDHFCPTPCRRLHHRGNAAGNEALAAIPSDLPDRRGRAGRYRQATLDRSRRRP